MKLPQLSPRDLFWLVLLTVAASGIGVAWWLDRRALVDRFDAQQEFLKVRGFTVTEDAVLYDIRADQVLREKIRSGEIIVDPIRRTFTPREKSEELHNLLEEVRKESP